MLKSGIIHPQLLRLLAGLGHTDTIVLSDAGLPIPKETERIDLAWMENNPRIVPVLAQLLQTMVVQKVYLAEEIKTLGDPRTYQAILEAIGTIPVEYIPHTQLKARSREARAVIRTGEFSPYPNVILESGCIF